MKKLVCILLIISASIILWQCASQTTPTGGPKDETPPTLKRSIPSNKQTNFKGKAIELTFDELLQLNNPKEEILITDEELNKSLDWLRKSRAQKQNPDTSEQGSENTQLPELTDGFAQTVGDFKTVEELKNAVRENMKFEKEQKAHDKQHAELLGAIADASSLEIPDILVESEKEKMTAELRQGI